MNQDGLIEVNQHPADDDEHDTTTTATDGPITDSGIGEPLDGSVVNGTTTTTTASDQLAEQQQQRTEIADCVDSSTVAIAGDSVLLNGDASVLEISEPAEPTTPAKPARRAEKLAKTEAQPVEAASATVVVPVDTASAAEETLSVQCAPSALAAVDNGAPNDESGAGLDDEQVRPTQEPRLLCCCAHASFDLHILCPCLMLPPAPLRLSDFANPVPDSQETHTVRIPQRP